MSACALTAEAEAIEQGGPRPGHKFDRAVTPRRAVEPKPVSAGVLQGWPDRFELPSIMESSPLRVSSSPEFF